MPLSLKYLDNKNYYYKILTILVLCLVAILSLYLISLIQNIDDNKITKTLALYGSIYFFIHVFFFDFIIWNYNFFI
jgi:hypothetical protein